MRATLLLIAATATAAPAVRWGDIPLNFEPNQGQAPAQVRYLARGSSYTLYLSGGEYVLSSRDASPLRVKLSGANAGAAIAGEAAQTSISNYFVGNDPRQWHTSVPNYSRLRYTGVYPGIDLVCYGKDGHLEYDWIVAPGADPAGIRMLFETTDRVRIDKHGDLVIGSSRTEYRHRKPIIYQETAGQRVPVTGTWALHRKEARFHIGAYDHRKRTDHRSATHLFDLSRRHRP